MDRDRAGGGDGSESGRSWRVEEWICFLRKKRNFGGNKKGVL